MIVYTAPLFFLGQDALDIAPGTTDAAGIVLAPLFGESPDRYAARLFGLSRDRGRVFSAMLALDSLTVKCSCLEPTGCHRTTLAASLISRGAIAGGERPRDLVPFTCGVRFCGAPVDTGQALCAPHWCSLPVETQRGLLATYRVNQRYTGLCSPAWMQWMARAIDHIAEVEKGGPEWLAPDPATGEPGYLAMLRIEQDKAWRLAMSPSHKIKATEEACKALWAEALGARDDELVARTAPKVAPPPGPVLRPKAPAKPRKRGGWQFQEGKS